MLNFLPRIFYEGRFGQGLIRFDQDILDLITFNHTWFDLNAYEKVAKVEGIN